MTRRLLWPSGKRLIALAAVFCLLSCGNTTEGPEGAQAEDPEGASSDADTDEASAQDALEEEIAQAEAARQEALAGPSEDHREEAAEIVEQMTTAERAGQIIIGEYESPDASAMAAQIADLNLGGTILMGHNIPENDDGVDVEELSEQMSLLADAGGEERAVAPIISVDQEGGLVTRVGAPLVEWPTPMAYGATYGEEQDTSYSWAGHQAMAGELDELGFTFSFAPNADTTIGAQDPTIGSRSFGSEPDAVGELALAGIRGLAEGGLIGSVKHFPGHGSVTEDSHATLPVQEKTVDQLQQEDWAPFAHVIEAGVPAVMMGHIDVPDLDAGVPSSLSAAAYDQIRQMGHDGVVVTDALNMAAIVENYGGTQAVVMALDAGADLLLMPSNVPQAHAGIVDAVESGQVAQERIIEAAERVVALALWQADLSAGELDAGPSVPIPEVLRDADTTDEDESQAAPYDDEAESDPRGTAEDVARHAITLVDGKCEANLTSDGLIVSGGSEAERQVLTQLAEDAGITMGQGAQLVLLGGSQPAAGGDIVVALDRPDGLSGTNAEAKIALFGRTEESFQALIEVLTGAASGGTLPVEVGEYSLGHSEC